MNLLSTRKSLYLIYKALALSILEPKVITILPAPAKLPLTHTRDDLETQDQVALIRSRARNRMQQESQSP